MPSSTSSIARNAAARFSSSRSRVIGRLRLRVDEPDELADRISRAAGNSLSPASTRVRARVYRRRPPETPYAGAFERRIGQGNPALPLWRR